MEHTPPFTQEEYLSGIGGSDAAAALNLNKWCSAQKLFNKKRGITPLEDPTPDMLRGQHLEPVAADFYTEETGNKVRRQPKTYRHKEHSFMYCHVDRLLTGQPGFIEIKCVRGSTFSAIQTEGPRDQDMIQVHHSLICTGLDFADLVYFSADDWAIEVHRIAKDRHTWKALIDGEKAFWKMVQTDTFPDDPPKEPVALLKSIAPETIVIESDPAGEWKNIVDSYFVAEKAVKQYKQEFDDAKREMMAMMGNAENVIVGGYRWRQKINKAAGGLNKDRLKHDYPDLILEDYKKDGTEYKQLYKKRIGR